MRTETDRGVAELRPFASSPIGRHLLRAALVPILITLVVLAVSVVRGSGTSETSALAVVVVVALAILLLFSAQTATNVRLYASSGTVGCVSAFGRRREIERNAVQAIRLLSVTVPTRHDPARVLIFLSAEGKPLLAMDRADLFLPTDIDHFANAAGLRLLGSFAECISLDEYNREYREGLAASIPTWVLSLAGALFAAVVIAGTVIFITMRR